MATMELNRDYWRNRSVLITGHTGFKGGWLSMWLRSMGAKVTGLALPAPTEPSLFECSRIGAGMDSRIGDVRDSAIVERTVHEAAPEIVFHLAAQPLVRASYTDPVGTYATNVMGTVNLLDALRRAAKRIIVIVVTSDKCYENRESMHAYREEEALGGHDPYSSSKACSELVASAYRCSFPNELHIATARAGNVIGGGDWALDRLLPDLVRNFSQGQTAIIRAPDSIRPWQHVLEPLLGYLLLAQAVYEKPEEFTGAWNFGPDVNDIYSVSDLANQAATQWGEGAHWQIDKQAHPHEAGILRLDSSKSRIRLGWYPRWDTQKAIQTSIEWYRCHLNNSDMRAYSLAQIKLYCNS